MRELKASTKAGQNIVNRAIINDGYWLDDVYEKPSQTKLNAWEWCFEQYSKDNKAFDFHICSHNTFNFSVAWYTVINGEQAIRMETRDNSYLVWLDR